MVPHSHCHIHQSGSREFCANFRICFCNKVGELGEREANERLGRIDRSAGAGILLQENAGPVPCLPINNQDHLLRPAPRASPAISAVDCDDMRRSELQKTQDEKAGDLLSWVASCDAIRPPS
jgi:hypothetical protein